VLLKEIELSVLEKMDDYAWRFPIVLWTYYYMGGHWHDGVATQHVAVEAARRRGERNGYARAMRGLGGALAELGEYAEARSWLRRAQELFEEIGDAVGLARTHLILGKSYEHEGRFRESLQAMEAALELSSAAGEPAGAETGGADMRLVRGAALNNSAWCRVHLGELEQARDRCLEAIELCQALGFAPGEAGTWDTLGYVYQRLESYDEAVRCFMRALDLGTAIGNRLQLANTLGHLAETHQAAGAVAEARAAWLRALGMYDDLRHRDADKVRAKIRELDAMISLPVG
jgi:tetratricopeptide (TPR) repeat protein